MKTIIRTAETHPLTWRLRDDKQPVWLDEYQSKNGKRETAPAGNRSAAYLRERAP